MKAKKAARIMVVLMTAAIVVNGQTTRPADDLSLLPMYGYPDREKPDHLKKSDAEFIKAMTAVATRKEAGRHFAVKGLEFWSKGDRDTAMRRFNQSWLLDPDGYIPHWGFGRALARRGEFAKAIPLYEKALFLIDEDNKKPMLLTDAGFVYSVSGFMIRTNVTDMTLSDKRFERANELFSQAALLSPDAVQVYDQWASSLYRQGNYAKAWEMVKKARGLGHRFRPDFIDSLSKEMPEPKMDQPEEASR